MQSVPSSLIIFIHFNSLFIFPQYPALWAFACTRYLLPPKTAVKTVSGPQHPPLSSCKYTFIQSSGIRNADQHREEKLSFQRSCCCLAQSCHFEGVYSEVFMHLPSGHNGRHLSACVPQAFGSYCFLLFNKLGGVHQLFQWQMQTLNNRRAS